MTRRGPEGEVLRTFVIITTDANALMAPIHGRMPAILEEADCGSSAGCAHRASKISVLHAICLSQGVA